MWRERLWVLAFLNPELSFPKSCASASLESVLYPQAQSVVRTVTAHKQGRIYIPSSLRLAECLPCSAGLRQLHTTYTHAARWLPLPEVWELDISLFIVGKQETRKCKAYLQAANTSSSPSPKLARCDLGAPEELTALEAQVLHQSRDTGSSRAAAGDIPNLLGHRASSEQAQRKLHSLQTCPKGLAQHRRAVMAERWCRLCWDPSCNHNLVMSLGHGRSPCGGCWLCHPVYALQVGYGTWFPTRVSRRWDWTMLETFRLQSQDCLLEPCNWCSL